MGSGLSKTNTQHHPLTVFSIIIFTVHTLVINKIFRAAIALRKAD